MLEVRDFHASHGAGEVVRGIDLDVARGETVALIGPNGAGKSTLLNGLSGTVPVRRGQARMDGRALIALPSHAIAAHGLVQVPEGRRVFAPLSVADNLRLGTVALADRRRMTAGRFDYVFTLFPRLAERRNQLAGTLSGGEQQMLAIGRALMSAPRVLLLDEPFLGLAPLVVIEIRRALDALRAEGLTMLLVEQKLDIALGFATRAYVIIKGRIALTDATRSIARRSDLAKLYFDLANNAVAQEKV